MNQKVVDICSILEKTYNKYLDLFNVSITKEDPPDYLISTDNNSQGSYKIKLILKGNNDKINSLAKLIYYYDGTKVILNDNCITLSIAVTLILNEWYKENIFNILDRCLKYDFLNELQNGPTDKSNWLIKYRILLSAYPDINLVNQFDIVVDLTETDLYQCDHKIHFPIKERQTADDTKTIELIKKLYQYYNQNQTLLIHCKNGVGRTGIISALLISLICKLDYDDTIKYITISLNDRKYYQGRASLKSVPSTSSQRHQIKKLITSLTEI